MIVPDPDARLSYVDLFAGCGGLSLGLEKAGQDHRGFGLVFAVEKSEMAAETFFHNFIGRIQSQEEWQSHLELGVREQAERGLVVRELRAVLDDQELLHRVAADGVDVVAGGPPCQGFSMAGRRDPDDPRNELPLQFLRFVEAVEPRAVIIENVVGISQDFDKHGRPAPFTQLGMALEQTGAGYVVQRLRLNAQDFGVPQHRPRMVLIGLRKDLAAKRRVEAVNALWRSDGPETEATLAPRPRDGTPRNVEEALWDIKHGTYVLAKRGGRYLRSEGEYANMMRFDRDWFPPAAIAERAPRVPANHRLARHAEKTTRRFELYRRLDWLGIPARVLSVHPDEPTFVEAALLIRSSVEVNGQRAPFPWRMPSGEILAGSVDDLVRVVGELHTRKHSQRPLRGDRPAPTVLTLPDDFVHYREPRIHTVRELARFQSFPDAFVFRSRESTGSHRRRVEVPQYTQVGNAVPPLLAKAIGDRLYELLSCGEGLS